MKIEAIKRERIIRALDMQSVRMHNRADDMHNKGNFNASAEYRQEANLNASIAEELRALRGGN
jgi:hypothetical protein